MKDCGNSIEHDKYNRNLFIASLLLKQKVEPDTVQQLTNLSTIEMQKLLQVHQSSY